jgi:hypothetical protein
MTRNEHGYEDRGDTLDCVQQEASDPKRFAECPHDIGGTGIPTADSEDINPFGLGQQHGEGYGSNHIA